jgi:hypothetical protein
VLPGMCGMAEQHERAGYLSPLRPVRGWMIVREGAGWRDDDGYALDWKGGVVGADEHAVDEQEERAGLLVWIRVGMEGWRGVDAHTDGDSLSG